MTRPGTTVLEQVELLISAARAGAPEAMGVELDRLSARLREPLRVAIAGRVEAGKSTLLNALVGELLAPTDAGECTQVVTWYVHGRSYRATLEPHQGVPFAIPLRRSDTGVQVDLGGYDVDAIARVVVEWPSSVLQRMTLIDTPGVGSLSGAGSASVELLTPGDEAPSPVDAVLFMTQHLHAGDLRVLDAFRHDGHAMATPVSALGVLSRADEISGGDADSMTSAVRIAARYARQPALRSLCQTVVPIAGLVAEAAATLAEGEFLALARLGGAPEDELLALLLSADRFTGESHGGCGLTVGERRHLLTRFGLWGVRLACELVRSGAVTSSQALSNELRRHSGLDGLSNELQQRFSARRDVLKARSALATLHGLFDRHQAACPEIAALRARLERIESGAHELAELRVLLAVRAGDVALDDDAAAELERVLGTAGDARSRLGLDPQADDAELRAVIVDGVARWRGTAEHPFASPTTVEASGVVVRTLEGLLA